MKFRISAIVIILVSIAVSAHATVKPSLKQLVDDSDWIIVGKVIDVVNPEAELGTAQIQLVRVLKGNIDPAPKELRLDFRRIGKRKIDFKGMKTDQKSYVFYIKGTFKTNENSVTLTDAWFGVEKASIGLEASIWRIVTMGKPQ